MSSFLPKNLLTSFSLFWSRCVFCSASIAILLFLIMLFTVDHLSIWSILSDGAAAPFMLSIAMQMFALLFVGVCVFISLCSVVSGLIWVSLPVAFGGAFWLFTVFSGLVPLFV